jgi:hypothetical protein
MFDSTRVFSVDPATAHHEAGHAVMSYALGLGAQAIIVRADKSGEFFPPELPERLWAEAPVALAWAVKVAAGPVAQLKFCALTGYLFRDGMAHDLERISLAAINIDRDPRIVLTLAWRLARRALDGAAIWRAVEAVADALAVEPVLTGREFRPLIERAGVSPGHLGFSALPDPHAADAAAEAEEAMLVEAVEAYEAVGGRDFGPSQPF